MEAEQIKIQSDQIQLQTKVDRLEKEKVDYIGEIKQLKNRIQQLESSAKAFRSSTIITKNAQNEDGKDAKASYMPRSCHDLKSVDPSLPSGNYMVDPDGAEVGDPAFSVYFDMAGPGEYNDQYCHVFLSK